MDTRLPWHDSLWKQVLQAWQQDHLPHALLLYGPQGMGKTLFAQRFARTLLCEKPQAEGQICGHCKSCHLLSAGTHPDFLQVEPAEVGKQIPIDNIRRLIQFSILTSQYGYYQIIIINPAEAMNRNAANSLLKLLEEPPPKTLLMLVSHQANVLLATIRSRCQRLDFSRPESSIIETWLSEHLKLKNKDEQVVKLLLNLSAQAPLAALNLAETEGIAKRQVLFESLARLSTGQHDPIEMAAIWNKQDVAQLLQWMLSWTMDMIRYATTSHIPLIVNYDHIDILHRLKRQLNIHSLFDMLDLQIESYRLVTGNANIKPQGLLESIAIAWTKLGTPHRR
ncbi:MAG: DNA polymerase III subunit delta' [Thiomargarita sp.]|nr:DNA polymerase III subunit delta' [Thiomargarita sp.]